MTVAAALAVAAAVAAVQSQPSAAATRMCALGLINLRNQGMSRDVWRSPVFLDSLIR